MISIQKLVLFRTRQSLTFKAIGVIAFISSALFVLLPANPVFSGELSEIVLLPGKNEISLTINNQSERELKSIQLSPSRPNSPEGMTVVQTGENVNLAAKSKTVLLLDILVETNVVPGMYQIPVQLKDGTHHTWNYTLTARFENDLPKSCELFQNYPNPFNALTLINYQLSNQQSRLTRLIIFDVLGQQICTLVQKYQAGGSFAVSWNGLNDQGQPVASGIYFYKLTSGDFTQTRKLLLIQ
jgi:hypothetical protein